MTRPAIAHINLQNLHHNYRQLFKAAGRTEIMAVVKANAYGHEQYLIALALREAGCCHFGVTDASEGAELRAMLGHGECEITLLSGIFDQEGAELCVDEALTPAITEPRQVELLVKAEFSGGIWLKFDSGMNRLGVEQPQVLYEAARNAGLKIRGFMSHLACADEPDHPLNHKQSESFIETCNNLDPNAPKSLLNSAGIISMPQFAFEVVRPGIALYGAEPVPEQPLGLKPVMTLTGEVMQIREIPAGASVSYGATFTAEKPMRIAVVGMGYADGIPRALSNLGSVFIDGNRHPIIGRVCMDYTMIDVSGSAVAVGDRVEFWGEHISANEVAASIDTISYTLFTGVGERVRRKVV